MRKLLVFQHSAREPLGVLRPDAPPRRIPHSLRQLFAPARSAARRQPLQRPHRARRPDERRPGGSLPASNYGDRRDPGSAGARHSRSSASASARSCWPRRSAPTCGRTTCARSAGIACIPRPRPAAIRSAATSTAASMCSSGMPTPSIFRRAPCTWPARRPALTRHSASAIAPTACSSIWKPTSN